MVPALGVWVWEADTSLGTAAPHELPVTSRVSTYPVQPTSHLSPCTPPLLPWTPAGTRVSGHKGQAALHPARPSACSCSPAPTRPHSRCFTAFEAFLPMTPRPASLTQAFAHLCPLPVFPTRAGHPASDRSLPGKRYPAHTPSPPPSHHLTPSSRWCALSLGH